MIVILTIASAGYIAFDFFQKWHNTEIVATREKEKEHWSDERQTLKNKVADLQSELEAEKEHPVPSEKVAHVFGESPTETPSEIKSPEPLSDCEGINKGIISYFTYLDQNGYPEKHKLETGTFGYFKKALTLMSKNKPQFAGNSAEILTLLRSMSHFYRVLGRQGTGLVKDIIKNEPELTEPTMAVFYKWFKTKDTCNNIPPPPSIEVMYEYSHFFLNTLPGKSYLFRRDPTVRILTTYYSILIIEQANNSTMNHYGLDTTQQARLLYNEIETHTGLLNKQTYLKNLRRMSGNKIKE